MAISRKNFSDETWGKMLQSRWDDLQSLVDAGVLDEHPLKATWNDHSKILRDARRDAANSGLGPRELEENDQPGAQAQDDPPPTPGTPNPPDRPGGSLAAQDAALEDLRIRQRGVNVGNELDLARARRGGNAETVAKMNIPGYGRLK
jgi:hypothetical protein